MKKEGKDSLEELRVLHNIAETYRQNNIPTFGIKYYEESIRIVKSKLGNCPRLFVVINQLGAYYSDSCHWYNANLNYSRAIQLAKDLNLENTLEYAALMHNIGVLYAHLYLFGNIENCFIHAKNYYNKACSIKLRKLGENDIDYVYSLSHLGSLYIDKYNKNTDTRLLQKAKCKLSKACEVQKIKLGENNADYASTLNGLGNINLAEGNLEQAEKDFNQAKVVTEMKLGKQSEQYKTIMHNLERLSYQKSIWKIQFQQDRNLFRKVTPQFLDTAVFSSIINDAMFLVKHHDINNQDDYTKIQELLNKGIELQNNGSSLEYEQLEELILIEPLQKLFSKRDSITVAPHLLAYYLLVKLHKLHNYETKAKRY